MEAGKKSSAAKDPTPTQLARLTILLADYEAVVDKACIETVLPLPESAAALFNRHLHSIMVLELPDKSRRKTTGASVILQRRRWECA
ncbi:MAG TPA: hypothetical protein VF480_08210 [Verrucomicrobiae bacterium]